jgi:hypothetical protein
VLHRPGQVALDTTVLSVKVRDTAFGGGWFSRLRRQRGQGRCRRPWRIRPAQSSRGLSRAYALQGG